MKMYLQQYTTAYQAANSELLNFQKNHYYLVSVYSAPGNVLSTYMSHS